MRVAAIWRYPVKSMHGESIQSGCLTAHGLEYDRLYAFESPAAPPGMLRLSGAERRNLLRFTARHVPAETTVTTPDGNSYPVTSSALLQHLALQHPLQLTKSTRPQTDVRPLALMSFQTIAQLSTEVGTPLDPRRFRANLYLIMETPFQEDSLVGCTLAIGATARIRILERDPRCRFITYDPTNPLGTESLTPLMKTLDRLHGTRAGVYASILTPGPIQVGDRLEIQQKSRHPG